MLQSKRLVQQERKNNSGRSMVEMLGTLAVMGVLSVGGITGYRYAMDKYSANQTINDINLRLTTLEMQLERDVALSLSEFGNTSTVGYTFDEVKKGEDGTVSLSIQGLSKSVCQIVKDGMSHYEIVINNKAENAECIATENGNALTFILVKNNDENNEHNEEREVPVCEISCPSGQRCEMGKCVALPRDGDVCSSSDDCGGVCGQCIAGYCRKVYLCTVGSCRPDSMERQACTANGFNGICDGYGICSAECDIDDDCGRHQICTQFGYCEDYKIDSIDIEVNGNKETWYYVVTKHQYDDSRNICDKEGHSILLSESDIEDCVEIYMCKDVEISTGMMDCSTGECTEVKEIVQECNPEYPCAESRNRKQEMAKALKAKGYGTTVTIENWSMVDLSKTGNEVNTLFGGSTVNVLCR